MFKKKFMKRIFFVVSLVITVTSHAQDFAFGRKMVDTLASSAFWGRGYTNGGMKKAADYLAGQFQSYGLLPMSGKNYFQEFTYPVNTFPGKMEVSVNGKE